MVDAGHGNQKRSYRVLVVDDYQDSAEVVCTILRFGGHTCGMAYSGRAAIAQAYAMDPTIVILDLSLPDMTGYDVARELKRNLRNTHVVALTGWDSPEKRAAAAAAGCDQYLVKPADAPKIRAIISAFEQDELRARGVGVND